MPTTITSAPTNNLATAYSNQKHACTLSDGTLVVVEQDTTTNGKFYYSQDNGATWTSYGSDIAGWSNGSIAAYVDTGGTERLVARFKQSGAGGGRTSGYLYVAVGTFNAGRTTLTWSGTVIDTTTDTRTNYPDIVAFADGSGGGYWVSVESFVISAGSDGRTYARWGSINSSGVPAYNTSAVLGTYGAGVDTYPSIDRNPTTGDLYAAWSAGTTGAGNGIRFKKATVSAGVPTWGSEVEVDNTVFAYDGNQPPVIRWDSSGSRAVIGMLSAVGTFQLQVWDSTSFTSFTNRLNTSRTDANNLYGFNLAIDPATGDIYLFGSNYATSAYRNVVYYKATRSGTSLSLGSMVTTDTFTGTASQPPYVYAWYSGSRVRWVYTKGSASPYAATYDSISFLTAVGKTNQYIWSVRTTINDTINPQWSLRAAVTKSRQLIWNVRATTSDTIQPIWNVRAALGKTINPQWSVRQVVGDVDEYVWNVSSPPPSKSVALVWGVRRTAANAVEVDWSVRQTATDLLATVWNVRAAVSDTAQMPWSVRSIVTDSLSAVWNAKQLSPANLHITVTTQSGLTVRTEMS